MGGLISVIFSLLSAMAFYGTGHPFLFWLCVVIFIFAFWSWGLMHNYAMISAKAQLDHIRENLVHEGKSLEEIQFLDRTPIHPSNADVNAVPDWLAAVNMLVTFAGIGMLIWGIIVRFF